MKLHIYASRRVELTFFAEFTSKTLVEFKIGGGDCRTRAKEHFSKIIGRYGRRKDARGVAETRELIERRWPRARITRRTRYVVFILHWRVRRDVRGVFNRHEVRGFLYFTHGFVQDILDDVVNV